jgi:hypothetical protein
MCVSWKKDACFRPKAGVPLHARYAPCQQAPRDLYSFKSSDLRFVFTKGITPIKLQHQLKAATGSKRNFKILGDNRACS